MKEEIMEFIYDFILAEDGVFDGLKKFTNIDALANFVYDFLSVDNNDIDYNIIYKTINLHLAEIESKM